ncbi:hypothetical protein FHS15_000780 [Paenibacillus castaneae]|nr:hypothetical protein [Paenibacillus castaneae]NIK75680.1 hypothetical protein [Paenibacillus castaneae]
MARRSKKNELESEQAFALLVVIGAAWEAHLQSKSLNNQMTNN